MQTLNNRIVSANSLLAPYAVPHGGLLGRPVTEPDDETRFPFQRDRDRIIHTQAFRRLQGKTQVFVAGENDHVRTRLTHTMEVAQISRDIARTLGLNEDLTECIALAHDLGHPPFGHMGEQALDDWMKTHGQSFEHNEQSLRIVTLLEEHSPLAPGLNLNREVLEGLQKHSAKTSGGRGHSLESQVVNLADEIAYISHDCDDGINAGLFTLAELQSIPLVDEAVRKASERRTFIRGTLIQMLVSDLYQTTADTLKHQGIQTLPAVYASPVILVGFSPDMRAKLDMLRAFLNDHMYGHPRVREPGISGQTVVRRLCDTLLEAPTEKVLNLQTMTSSTIAEAVKDYVAGMTDAFARAQLLK